MAVIACVATAVPLAVSGSVLAGCGAACADPESVFLDVVRTLRATSASMLAIVVFLAFRIAHYRLYNRRRGSGSGPGPLAAAKPGLICKIRTLPCCPRPESDGECCICHGEFDGDQVIKETPCGHVFHEACLGTWLGSFGRTCPLCRTDLEVAVLGKA